MNITQFTNSFDACVGHADKERRNHNGVSYEVGKSSTNDNTFYYKIKDKIGRTWGDGGFSMLAYADIEAKRVIDGLKKQGDV